MSLILPVILFALGIGFTLYPILPGALFALGGMIVYGLSEGWAAFPTWFWIVQGCLVALNFSVDWITSILGIKRVGGSKQAILGTLVGTLLGPVLLGPLPGILVGPAAGAMAGELIHLKKANKAGQIVRVGVATLIGFLLGTFLKLMLVLLQIGLFAWRVW